MQPTALTGPLTEMLHGAGQLHALDARHEDGAATAITLMISSPLKLAVLMGRAPSAASTSAGSRDRLWAAWLPCC